MAVGRMSAGAGGDRPHDRTDIREWFHFGDAKLNPEFSLDSNDKINIILDELPEEIILKIISYLDARSLCILFSVNKTLNRFNLI